MIGQSRLHRRGHAQRLMNSSVVVVHEVQRYRVAQVWVVGQFETKSIF